MKLDGVAALVTGGASGLGAATAAALIAQGAKVALLDFNETMAQETAKRLGAVAVKCDVTSEASVKAAIDAAQAANGPARVLVNCAGIGKPQRMLGREGTMPLDDFARIISTNLIGTFNVIRLFAEVAVTLDALDSGERGVIINTASVAAYDGQIGQTAYSASKAGIVGLTLPLARELAKPGIRVCTIAPGIFETPMLAGLPEEAQKSLAASIPFPPRLGRPDEYAKLALSIIDNEMLNGETIRIDGAIRMAPR